MKLSEHIVHRNKSCCTNQATHQGKTRSPLLSAAQQDWLASGLCHCKHTYEQLLFIQVSTDPTPVHCSTVQGKMQCPHCSVLLSKTGLHQACINANTPMKICSSYRSPLTQHQCTAALFRAKCSPHCSVLLSKTGLHQACITANTTMKICSSYRCAVTQHQCTAALFRAKCNPHCSVLLCKTG